MWKPYSRSNSRSDSRNWLDAKISAQILGAFFSKLGWSPRARVMISKRVRGRETHPRSRNTTKTPRLHELFEMFPRTFSFFPVTRVRNIAEIVQKNLFRRTLFWVEKRTGCGFLAYSWKLPAYSGAFYLQLTILAFWLTIGAFFAYSFSFFAYSWSFFAYNRKVHLVRALRDCKQRSLTVRKKAPTVSKKASPDFFSRSVNILVRMVTK